MDEISSCINVCATQPFFYEHPLSIGLNIHLQSITIIIIIIAS